ncbi:hypothetical protein VOLCADRAFT_103226 [Volvox carteri f. nagariensis]|uniref:Secreted protein n=1 Tax=Volvox carteri f. nagariensis TaxID=3068 RepID=D8TKB3_VOLCA|nr:uncharacterized protein VOLCADRAFT_103226 [Volvox carteri f. nagariensis]EFJ52219.1 hypothetical protein VOLCADRAFT_103226 [Volvox carteri f. nagariensis]|eukprot:XP_002946993.1 hypothetical protein VOLCADRAFT_103226 [Volvox carteri f. nagariensis]
MAIVIVISTPTITIVAFAPQVLRCCCCCVFRLQPTNPVWTCIWTDLGVTRCRRFVDTVSPNCYSRCPSFLWVSVRRQCVTAFSSFRHYRDGWRRSGGGFTGWRDHEFSLVCVPMPMHVVVAFHTPACAITARTSTGGNSHFARRPGQARWRGLVYLLRVCRTDVRQHYFCGVLRSVRGATGCRLTTDYLIAYLINSPLALRRHHGPKRRRTQGYDC